MPEKTVAAAMEAVPPFVEMVPEEHRLTNSPLTTMQVNIGYRCNLACRHCHLSCGPKREEMMNREVMQACLDAYERNGFSAVDITGGAPEMHPELEWFLREWQKRGVKPICRTNLCILTDPQYAHFAQLYADVDATLFASLPFYSARNVDKVRGEGAFDTSLEGLRLLNDVGYGDHDGEGDTHTITLVFNPSSATFPPPQAAIENEYRTKLTAMHGVHFSNSVAITNNPSGRFAEALHLRQAVRDPADQRIRHPLRFRGGGTKTERRRKRPAEPGPARHHHALFQAVRAAGPVSDRGDRNVAGLYRLLLGRYAQRGRN